jgi:hypothetical protein
LSRDRCPHLGVVRCVFLFEFPVDDHKHLKNPNYEPVRDRLLREQGKINLILSEF